MKMFCKVIITSRGRFYRDRVQVLTKKESVVVSIRSA